MGALRFLALTWLGRSVVGVLVIAVVGATVVAPRLTTAPPQAAVRTATVARGNVLQTVSVSGSVNASALVRAAFKPSGRIAAILVKVGDRVTAGQPLARLDPTDLQTSVKQAEASLLSAQAKYDTTVAGATAEDIALAKNSLDSAQLTYDQSKKTTATEVTNAQQALDKAKRALADAKVTTANDTATALQALNKVRTGYASARTNFASLTSGIKMDVASYQDAIVSLRAQVATLISQIENGTYVRTTDVNSVRTSLISADLSLSNARTYAAGSLQSALAEYQASVDAVTAAANAFDGAVAHSGDTASAASQYQTASASYQIAAPRLSGALDAPAAQVTSAQTSLNSSVSRADASLDTLRGDIVSLQTALTAEGQLTSSLRTKVTQAGTSLSTIGDNVNGSYVSAQAAYSSALTKAQTTVQSAQDTVTSAEQAVATAQDKVTSSLASQEIALRNAQVNYSKTTGSPKSSDVASALSSLQLAQISLEKAKNDLEGATLRSPAAGVVSSVANQVGEAPANPFAVIAVIGVLTLHGTVGEAEVAKLKLGQVATLAVDAVGTGTRLTGKITGLDPVATIQQGVPVYGVDITIDIPDPAVRPGMTGTATVIVASKQDVLTVPNTAIRTTAGRRAVQVMRDGAAQNAQVVFGIASETVTEVVSGLAEGDTIVLPAPRTTTTAGQGGQIRLGGGPAPVPGGVPFR